MRAMPFRQLVKGKYRVRIVVPSELRPDLPRYRFFHVDRIGFDAPVFWAAIADLPLPVHQDRAVGLNYQHHVLRRRCRQRLIDRQAQMPHYLCAVREK